MKSDKGYQEALKRIDSAERENSHTLDLSNLGLGIIPNEISSLSKLQILFIYKNQITEIPKAVASLTQLQILFLNNNQIAEIPKAVVSLTQLRELYGSTGIAVVNATGSVMVRKINSLR